MRTVASILGFAAVALLVASSTCHAGPLPADGNAIPGWQGSVAYVSAQGPLNLNAAVEYAVYAPNPGASKFDATFGPGADPTNGAHYVYAYQVYNLSSAFTGVIQLSVGLDGDEPISSLDSLPILGIDPLTAAFNPAGGPPFSNVLWKDYGAANGRVNSGQNSSILFFTSPFGPEFDDGAIQANLPNLTHQLPSPTPEPSTLLLAGLAVALSPLFGRRILASRRRRG
jgi:hypothetical protein